MRSNCPGRQPIVLVVEDNAPIRAFICDFLRAATSGVVMDAADPYNALAMAHSCGRSIELLISDIDLAAGKSGIDLARELSARDPSLNVLLMSAGKRPPADIPSGWRFLEKPFPLGDLLDCIQELCPAIKPAATSFRSAGNQSAA